MSRKPSWQLKVQRAEQHLVDAEAIIARYVGRNPYEVTEGVEDDQGGTLRFLRFTEQPDDLLALVIGDLIHNLRSALNHLACACTPRENWRTVQFPIFEVDPATVEPLQRRKSALKAWNDQTAGMIPEAVAVLKLLQPYYPGPDDKSVHGLSIVEKLSNTDKHRELVVTASGLRNPVITTTVNGTSFRQEIVGDVKDGAQITTAAFPREVDVQINGTTLVVVDLGEDEGHVELPGTLHTVIQATRNSAIPALIPYVLP